MLTRRASSDPDALCVMHLARRSVPLITENVYELPSVELFAQSQRTDPPDQASKLGLSKNGTTEV